MSNWVYQQENRIFTLISYRVSELLKSKYSDIFFTRDPEPDDTTNHFPTIYMNFLSAEFGNDLLNEDINAIKSTIKVEVIGNKTIGLDGTRQIAYTVLDELKKMRYSAVTTPQPMETGNDTKEFVFEVRRTIGSADIL